MTLLRLKQEASRLTVQDRRDLAAYLIRLQHQGPAWRRMVSKRMRAMDAGRKVTLPTLEQRLARG